MKGGYGSFAHEEKVEDYGKYKERISSARQCELKEVLSRIKESSLTKEDKMKLFDEFILVIIKEKYKI